MNLWALWPAVVLALVAPLSGVAVGVVAASLLELRDLARANRGDRLSR